MFNLSKEQLIEYLNTGVRFEIVCNNKTHLIDFAFSIFLNGYTSGEMKVTSYKIDEKEYKTQQSFLKALNQLETNSYIQVNKIGTFSSIEEFEENIKFQNADMKYLLDKYNDCNVFCLCSYYGEHKLSKETADRCIKSQVDKNKDYLLKTYEKFKSDYSLPPFETLYQDIKKECLEFGDKQKEHYINKNNFFRSFFICDHVGKDTKYGEPLQLFWHFYHMLGSELDYIEQFEKLTNLKEEYDVRSVLDKEEYKALKPYLISTNITLSTHCSGGPLQTEFKFQLNEISKKWLLLHKNDYDFSGELQDLAFYKDEKLRFSSCTHENFHDDIL